MKLYLIRHPQTSRNLRDKLTGWERTIYTEEGRNQFRGIVNFFKNKNIKKTIYSSDLPRAKRLAEAIAKETKNDIHITKKLREQNFKETKPVEHFETEKEFEKRVFKFLEKTKIIEGIIVSHSGVIKEIINLFFGENKKNLDNIPRNVIFLIESNKKQKNLKKIRT